MKRRYLRTARTAAVLVFSVSMGSAAWADCADELAELAGGISQDGTMAPMGTDPALATSVEDVQAQQQGDSTAAEQAESEAGSSEASGRDAAVSEAEAALASGDEAGCMAALEKAKGM